MDEAVDEAVDEAKGCSIVVYMGCSNVPLNCNLTLILVILYQVGKLLLTYEKSTPKPTKPMTILTLSPLGL